MSRSVAVAVAVALAVAAGVLAWWATGATAARTVVPSLVWAAILAVVVLVGLRHRLRRRAHLARVGARAAEAERSRLATDMHDVLGHELALLATQAAGLEMTPASDPAGQAATIRRRAESAVERLHDVVRLLGASDRTAAPDLSTRAVLDEATAAGLDLRVRIDEDVDDPRETDPVVAASLTGLVREAVTNAARHAPGRTVTVTVSRDDDTIRLVVENEVEASRPAGRRSGLTSWDRRLRVIGGTLTVGLDGVRHRLEATIPARADLRSHLDRVPVERPPWVLGLAAPLLALFAAVVGTWGVAAHDRTLSAEEFTRLRVGQPLAEVTLPLPPADALLVLDQGTSPATEPGTTCRFFTDGNLPLAQASFQVCVADGRVLALRDLR